MIPARISWVFGFRHFLFLFEYFIQLKFDFYRRFFHNIYHSVSPCSHIAIYFLDIHSRIFFYFSYFIREFKKCTVFFICPFWNHFPNLNRVRYFFLHSVGNELLSYKCCKTNLGFVAFDNGISFSAWMYFYFEFRVLI